MNIYSRIFSIALFALSGSSVCAAPAAGTYAIDPAHTTVYFSIDHLGYTSMMGRFNELSGAIVVDDKGQSASEITIAAASVDTNHGKRDDHLRSPDFFNAKQFPEIRFTSEVDLNNEDTSSVDGELKLLGVTKPVVFELIKGKDAKDPWGLSRIGYTATSTFKRSDYGMNFMQGGLGDDITVTIFIEAVKQ